MTCLPPPVGCHYVGGSCTACGSLVCPNTDGCVPTPCPAPPPGCVYEGGGPCECGTLVCGPDAGVCPWSTAVYPSTVCADGAEVPTFDILIHDPNGCFCGETIACSASQEGTTIHLDVRAEACGALCDACFRDLRGSCRLDDVHLTPSPLYDVTINNVLAFTNLSWGGSQCWTPALPVDGSLICQWPGTRLSATDVTDVCVPADVGPGAPIVLRTTACLDDCFSQEAGCEIRPTATGYDIAPLVRSCECPTCGACAPGCHERSFYCTLPPLANGSYTITMAGSTRPLRVSEVGSDNLSCDDRPIPFP